MWRRCSRSLVSACEPGHPDRAVRHTQASRSPSRTRARRSSAWRAVWLLRCGCTDCSLAAGGGPNGNHRGLGGSSAGVLLRTSRAGLAAGPLTALRAWHGVGALRCAVDAERRPGPAALVCMTCSRTDAAQGAGARTTLNVVGFSDAVVRVVAVLLRDDGATASSRRSMRSTCNASGRMKVSPPRSGEASLPRREFELIGDRVEPL